MAGGARHAGRLKRWRLVTSPNASNGKGELDGIAAVSSRDLWAVGDGASSNVSAHKTLIEHYNGKRWTVVKSPNSRG